MSGSTGCARCYVRPHLKRLLLQHDYYLRISTSLSQINCNEKNVVKKEVEATRSLVSVVASFVTRNSLKR